MFKTVSEQTLARLGWVMLGLAIVAFAAEQRALWPLNGYWIDEYATLWITDPGTPLSVLMKTRILTDNVPPPYPLTFYAVRHLVPDSRTAFLTIDVVGLALCGGFTLWTGRARGRATVALFAVAALIVSGPIVCYAPEGRPYLLAMCAAFAIAWLAALAMQSRASRTDLAAFAGLGLLAAGAHVFAGVFACSAAGAMASYGLIGRRPDMLRAAAVLGGVALAALAIYVLQSPGHIQRLSWIMFSGRQVRNALWVLRSLAIGRGPGLALLAIFAALCLLRPATRPLIGLFAVTFALFLIAPLLASFKVPLFVGRYLLIGAPALTAMTVLLIEAQLRAPGADRPQAVLRIAGVVAGVAFVLAASWGGFETARRFTAQKPIWRGAPVVASQIAACPDGSVHVLSDPTAVSAFSVASGGPPSRFVDAREPSAPTLAARDARCPVIGWAEHLVRGRNFALTAPDAQLLGLLKISAAPGEVEIRRHRTGFVVLRR